MTILQFRFPASSKHEVINCDFKIGSSAGSPPPPKYATSPFSITNGSEDPLYSAGEEDVLAVKIGFAQAANKSFCIVLSPEANQSKARTFSMVELAKFSRWPFRKFQHDKSTVFDVYYRHEIFFLSTLRQIQGVCQ